MRRTKGEYMQIDDGTEELAEVIVSILGAAILAFVVGCAISVALYYLIGGFCLSVIIGFISIIVAFFIIMTKVVKKWD